MTIILIALWGGLSAIHIKPLEHYSVHVSTQYMFAAAAYISFILRVTVKRIEIKSMTYRPAELK